MSKTCPYCGAQIPDNAQKCRFCGEWVVPAEQRHRFDSYTIDEGPRPVQNPRPSREPMNQPREGRPYYNNNNADERPQGFFDLFFVKTLFHHYSDYNGRVGRRDFWCAILAYAIVSLAVSGVCWGLTAIVPYGTEFVLTLIISIAWGALTILPVTAVITRRLNDAAYSKWWLMLLLVPFVGWLGLLILCSLPTTGTGGRRPENFAFGVSDAILTIICVAVFITGWLMYDGVLTFGRGDTEVIDSTLIDSTSLFETDTIIETAPTSTDAPAATTSSDSTSAPAASAPAEGNLVAPSSGYDPELGYDTASYL